MKINMNKHTIGCALFCAALAPMQLSAAEFKISGQVNSAVVFGGEVQDPTIVDNNTQGSRFRFQGSTDINADYKAGFRYEMQVQDNNSTTLGDGLTEIRYSDVWFSGNFGKLGIGKGDGAANNTFEAYSLINFMAGGLGELLFRGSTNLGYRTKDGIGRQNRVRYDSPNFNGFSVAVSLDNDDTNEYALRYKQKLASGKLDARLGVADRVVSRTSYSVAYKHNSGVSASYSFGEDDVATGEDDVDWIMLGYDVVDNVTLSFGTGEENGGDEMQILAVLWAPTKGVEMYFHSMDYTNADNSSGDAMALGSRFKF